MRSAAIAFLSGLVFAVGLGLSRMTDPGVVIGFLDVAGNWQPALLAVMAGGIGVHVLSRRVFGGAAAFEGAEWLPSVVHIDRRTVVGAVLFGAGWGLGGFCPGPAVVGMVTGAPEVLVFVGAMVGGMALEASTSRTADRASHDDCTADGGYSRLPA